MGGTDVIMDVARDAAREAGRHILGHMGNIKEVSYKEGVNNFVTDVDKAAENIIIEKIKKVFPGHSILAEESGEHASEDDTAWVIDPLDGTVNYTHGFPFFCVSIGVARDGIVKAGVVYDPVRDEMFEAQQGAGALMNGKDVRVSAVLSVKDSLAGTGFAYTLEGKAANMDFFARINGKAQGLRRAGAAALDLCYVACGRLDGFWEFNLSPWDTAAGHLIVSEAGGKVSRLDGGEYDIHDKDILATNGLIHAEMARVLNGR